MRTMFQRIRGCLLAGALLVAVGGCTQVQGVVDSVKGSVSEAKEEDPVVSAPGGESVDAGTTAGATAGTDPGGTAASSPARTGESTPLYTRCNIWYEKSVISSINYKRGLIIPAGTPVTNVSLVSQRRSHALRFTAEGHGTFEIALEDKYAPTLSMKERQDRFITTRTLDRLTEGMSETELECIRTGVLKEGMSKDAVIIAWGYPPAHRTPGIQGNIWVYWSSRFVEKKIYFGPDGRTTAANVVHEGAL